MDLIERGIPAITLITEDFVLEAQMITKARGAPFEYVVFPRTMDAMSREQIEAEIDRAYDEIVNKLVQVGQPA